MITSQEQERISAAIAAVEQQTDAELVTVLAKQSDDYRFIPTLWAALLALLTPMALGYTHFWLQASDLQWVQLVVFVVLALLFRWPPLMLRLVPRSIRHGRAAGMARRQFLAQQLHHTKDATGVLIFVSERERYVEILADQGINQHVKPEQWQTFISAFVARIQSKQVADGFIECIQSCGALLKTHVPATVQKNELPNHLVMI